MVNDWIEPLFPVCPKWKNQLRLPELVVSFSSTSWAPPYPAEQVPRGPRIKPNRAGRARPVQGSACGGPLGRAKGREERAANLQV